VTVHESDPRPFADRTDPAVCGTPVEALTVVAEQNRSFSPLTDGEVDGSGGARYQRDERGLVALPDDPQYPEASLEGHVLDVVSQASLTRSPFKPSSTARAAWV
jgi:hypothetical protein